MRPSFIGLIVSGILLLLSFIVFVINMSKIRLDTIIVLIILFTIAISLHSIQHAFEEVYFNFNPLTGHWSPKDNPSCPCNKKYGSCPCGKNCKCMQ